MKNNQAFGKLQNSQSTLSSSQDLLNLKQLSLQDQQLNFLKDKIALQNNALIQNDNLQLGLNVDSLLKEKNNLMNLFQKGDTINSLIDLKGNLNFLSQQNLNLNPSNHEINNIINDQINNIINDLNEAGVAEDTKGVSFTLDYDQLIVNGKKQSAELHEKLRKKYILRKKDHYKCEVKPNSRSTEIYKE